MRVLLAFDNGRGIIYARTSGWQRVYLLWTFRNFRRLPQKILTPRQQELVATLYRTSVIARSREFEDGVIGTVEEFRLRSSASDRGANQQRVSDVSDNNLAHAQSLQPDPLGEPFYARPAFSRMTLRIGAGALLVLVAAFAWYQMRAQPAFTSRARDGRKNNVRATDRAAPTPRAADAGTARAESVQNAETPAAPLPLPITTQAATSAQPPMMGSLGPAPAPAGSSGSARAFSSVSSDAAPREKAMAVHHVPLAGHGMIPAPADQPRVLISGPPRKLVYPVCPATEVRGKVSLRAVIDHNGGVSQVQVLTGSRVLAAAAIAAVRQWSYPPFSRDIPLAERETNITVAFISNEVVAVSFPDPASVSVSQTTANAAQR